MCPTCSNPVKLGDLLEVKDISAVLEASRYQETSIQPGCERLSPAVVSVLWVVSFDYRQSMVGEPK